MSKTGYFNKFIDLSVKDFLKHCILSFEKEYGVSLTVHAMTGRWFDEEREFLFSNLGSHRSEYCLMKRYKARKNDKACLENCAFMVERESLRTMQPFTFSCWKGVKELVVPFAWDGTLELIFYIGPFRGEKEPEEKILKQKWKTLPDFPEEKADDFIMKCTTLGMSFYARQLHKNRTNNITPGRKEQIMDYIERYGCRQIHLRDLAAHIGVSLSRTSHLCDTLFGVSFQEFVLNVRMKRAKQLLLETNNPIKEIAEQTGFTNEFYFNRMFRHYFGSPPGKYRSEHKKNQSHPL